MGASLYPEVEEVNRELEIPIQLYDQVREIRDVSETKLIGGQRRQLKILPDPARMAAFHVDPIGLIRSLEQANRELPAGSFSRANTAYRAWVGEFLKSAEEVGRLVVGSWGGRPVYLPDVASVQDGPEEVRDYVFFVPGPAAAQEGIGAPQRPYPAVTLSIGKQKGANAVVVTDRVLEKIEALKGVLIPSDVHVTVTRNYGETAQEKSNEVLEHVLITVIAVTTLISLFLGSRACGPRNALPFPALCRKICSRDSKPRKQFTMLQCIHDMGDSTLRENNTRRPVLKVHI